MELNHEWIDENFSSGNEAIELFMDAHRRA